MHRVFISYHHANDQRYKNELKSIHDNISFFDMSVDTGDIDEGLNDETIRVKIRDEYLKDSTVTIVLVGTNTKDRKHVDWEIYSSMFNSSKNKKSGILIVNLPTINGSQISISEKDKDILGRNISWSPISSYERYNYMPKRLVDNVKEKGVRICVVDYNNIINNTEGLKFLLNEAFENKELNNYNLSEKMRRRNG